MTVVWSIIKDNLMSANMFHYTENTGATVKHRGGSIMLVINKGWKTEEKVDEENSSKKPVFQRFGRDLLSSRKST